ncbi:hypothetical protein [Cysteiniphilum sp. JM-1]|uniref:hypothetical protein n=1 Tax=Cysteiniphilum sp. JM-1 TaxID=2610891 RepID=UPI00124563A2|nr:hypothetical protein [Cysteiniphilum sp. JM-1]
MFYIMLVFILLLVVLILKAHRLFKQRVGGIVMLPNGDGCEKFPTQSFWHRNWAENKIINDDYYAMYMASERERKVIHSRRICIFVVIYIILFFAFYINYKILITQSASNQHLYELIKPYVLYIVFISMLVVPIWYKDFLLWGGTTITLCLAVFALRSDDYIIIFLSIFGITESLLWLSFLCNKHYFYRLDKLYFLVIYKILESHPEYFGKRLDIMLFMHGFVGLSTIWMLTNKGNNGMLFAFKIKFIRYVFIYPWLLYLKSNWFEELGVRKVLIGIWRVYLYIPLILMIVFVFTVLYLLFCN